MKSDSQCWYTLYPYLSNNEEIYLKCVQVWQFPSSSPKHKCARTSPPKKIYLSKDRKLIHSWEDQVWNKNIRKQASHSLNLRFTWIEAKKDKRKKKIIPNITKTLSRIYQSNLVQCFYLIVWILKTNILFSGLKLVSVLGLKNWRIWGSFLKCSAKLRDTSSWNKLLIKKLTKLSLLKGVFANIQADIELNLISIATKFTLTCCVYKEKMVKHVLYPRT